MNATTRLALVLGSLLAAGMARADGYLASDFASRGSLLVASWEVGVPVGAWRDFVDRASTTGVQVEGRFRVARLRSAGLALSWNRFSQSFASETVQLPNATVSGPAYHRTDLVALRATFHEYLSASEIQPYLGAGVGGVWHESYRELVALPTRKSGFGFAVDPQIGVLVTFAYGFAVDACVRYQFTTAQALNGKDAQSLGFQLGVALY